MRSRHIQIGVFATLLLITALAAIAAMSGNASPGQWAVQLYRDSFSILALILAASGFSIALSIVRKSAGEREIPSGLSPGLIDGITLYLPAFAGLLMLVLLPQRQLEDPPAGPGDSLHLSTFIPVFSHLFGFLATPDELLELFIRSRLYLLLDGFLSLPYALGLYSYVAGMVALGVVSWFIRGLPIWSRPVAWLVLFFTPSAALFAGYIENYSMATALISSVLLLGWRILEIDEHRKTERFRLLRLVAAISAIAAAHHLIAGFLLPALVYLVFRVSEGRLGRFVREGVVCGFIGGGILLLIYGAFALSPHGGMIFAESHASNPAILSVAGAFSSRNLSRMLQILLLFPLIPAYFFGATLARIRRHQPDPSDRRGSIRAVGIFLGLAVIPFLTHAFFWKSTIGFPADWDLFSFFCVPLHVWILHRLIAVETSGRLNDPGLLAIAAVTLFPALLWLGRLHGESPGTRASLEYLKTVPSILSTLKKDDTFARLSDDGKKNHIRLLLFEHRVTFLFDHVDLSPDEREEATEQLQQGMALYRREIVHPTESTNEMLTEVQGHLFRVFRVFLAKPVHP